MLTISSATPKDLPDILSMIRKLCAFHGDTCRAGLADIQARLIGGPLHCLVAHLDGRPVGYTVLETLWRPMFTGDALDVTHLFVAEHARGLGVGKSLIGAAKDHAIERGATRLTIGTAANNPGAAAAYRAMGLDEITDPAGPRFAIAVETALVGTT